MNERQEKRMEGIKGGVLDLMARVLSVEEENCQEIGLVAFIFFFELLFSYVSLTISFYVFPY